MQIVSIPLFLGRVDSKDAKIAPLGFLATAKNLRVRKDGRLVSRNGYELLSAACPAGTMVAYDVTSYRQRLVAMGNAGSDGYPTELFEFTNVPTSTPWRGTDNSGASLNVLNPLTNWREVCGIPQPDSGVAVFDVAMGGGYVCTAYRPAGTTTGFYQIVRESDDQVIAAAPFAGSTLYTNVKVCYASSAFWFLGTLADNSVVLSHFTPGTDTAITGATTVDAANGTAVSAFEIRAISNPSTGVVITAMDRGAATDILIKRWTSASAQDGSTLSVASLTSVWLDIEADATDNTVNLFVVAGTSTATLRTFNFANTLTVGPTSTTVGRRGQICRCPLNTPDQIAVAVNSETGSIKIQWFVQTTHAVSASFEIFEAQLSTSIIDASSTGNPRAIVLGGWVEPKLAVAGASFNTDSFPTNALFWCTSTMAHMATRDLRESSRFLPANRMGLSYDSSISRAAWCSTYSFDVDQIDHPSITTFDFKSTKRRQSAEYGGMLYIAGGCPSVYDGHLNTEIGFNEIPGIQSVTPSNSTGALTSLGTYQYVYGWEFTHPDGSVTQGPISDPVVVTMGAADDTNTIVATTPHSVRVMLGAAVYGSDVSAVLYRTEWDATNGIVRGVFRRCLVQSVPTTTTSYGQTISLIDLMSDATLASQPPVYTQADRGSNTAPLAHNSPEACSYISSSSARLLIGALARSYEFQESNESFLGEPISFTRFPNFFGKASSQINGVVSLDGIRFICSRERIYASFGQGPDDTGAGALPSPVELASPAGLLDWKSLLVAPDGVYMQIDPLMIYRFGKDGGSPEWIGIDIQDTLASYPTVSGTARVRRDDAIAFACTTSTDARIVLRSMRTGIWIEDSPPLQTNKGIEALCEYNETVAYVSGGRVYVLSPTSGFADTSSTVITTQWKTHPIYPFQLGGYGTIHGVLVTGEFRSAGTLALRVSYDDGVSFTTYDSFTITGLTVGQTVQRRWAMQQTDTTSVVFEWTFTPSAAGEGLILHNAAIMVDAQTNELRELDPAEMA